MAGLLYLPSQNWGVAPRQDIVETAKAVGSASSRQIVLAAEGRRIPVVLGRDRIAPLIANYVPGDYYSYVVAVWAQGPVAAIEGVTVSDVALSSSVLVRHYLGSSSQTVDAPLAAAFAAQGISYSDSYPGIAYSVFQVPPGLDFDLLSITAIVRGCIVFDPRVGESVWSDNPTLLLAHVVVSLLGRSVVWDSVAVCADANDEMVGGARRRRLNMTLSDPVSADALISTLRTYAACWLVPSADGLRFVPDRPSGVVKSIGPDCIFSLGPIERRRRADQPTVMTVSYTDITATPWRDASVTVRLPGVDAGIVPWRESEVPLPGIQSASQAMREAIERLNKSTLQDISFPFAADDTAVDLEPGDVVEITHPLGLSAKQVRISEVESTGPGRFTLKVSEYDPAVYSDAVVTDPTTPDTRLPSPSAPPPVTGLAASEVLMKLRDGTCTSRIVASWDPLQLPWIAEIRIDIRIGLDIVATGTAPRSATSWPSPPVRELVSHQVDVYAISLLGATSAVASVTITPQGKMLPPGDVPRLTGYEVGGEVRLRWDAAEDIDIWRYEIRWGAPGVSWSAAALLDRVDALSLISKDSPAGTWDYLVCALDSVGNYSPSPARKTITVTLDAASILVDRHSFSAPSASGMQEYSLWPGDPFRRWITEDGVPMADKFVGPLADYPDLMGVYSSGGNSWQTETYDFGLLLSGNWSGELSVTPLAGTVDQYLDLSPDGSSWLAHAGLAAKTGGRFARLRVNVTGAALVLLPLAQLRIDAIPRQEEGTATSSASGPCTVTLAGVYALSKGLPQITVAGTGFATATVDNIVTGDPTSFDVYVFDESANLIERDIGYVWKGI